MHPVVTPPALDAQRSLTGSGQADLGRQILAGTSGQSQPGETGSGQHEGIVLAIVQLAQTGVHVAPDGLDQQIGTPGQKLRAPAQARRAHPGAGGQPGQNPPIAGNQHVAGILAIGDHRHGEPFRKLRWHVLDRMHGEVGPTRGERLFQLLDEQALAANLGEGRGQPPVPTGGDAEQFHSKVRMSLAQTRADEVGLPQGKLALPRGDDEPQIAHRLLTNLRTEATWRRLMSMFSSTSLRRIW